jgi:hypothetical protein
MFRVGVDSHVEDGEGAAGEDIVEPDQQPLPARNCTMGNIAAGSLNTPLVGSEEFSIASIFTAVDGLWRRGQLTRARRARTAWPACSTDATPVTSFPFSELALS